MFEFINVQTSKGKIKTKPSYNKVVKLDCIKKEIDIYYEPL